LVTALRKSGRAGEAKIGPVEVVHEVDMTSIRDIFKRTLPEGKATSRLEARIMFAVA
jgi:hypothetical protein